MRVATNSANHPLQRSGAKVKSNREVASDPMRTNRPQYPSKRTPRPAAVASATGHFRTNAGQQALAI
jgi:hypothetical protein